MSKVFSSLIKLSLVATVAFSGIRFLNAQEQETEEIPEEVKALMPAIKDKSEAGKKDCDKAAKDADAAMEANMDNPLAAIGAAGKFSCTYLETIAWKAPEAKRLPKIKKGKNLPSVENVYDLAADFWATSDDVKQVTVLRGGVTGSAWSQTEMSDAPGVPKGRTIQVYHAIKADLADGKKGCFIVFGQIKEENANHPHKHLRPSWGGGRYQAAEYERAKKIDCKIAK